MTEQEKTPVVNSKRFGKELQFEWPRRFTRYETWDSEATEISFGKVHDAALEILVKEYRHYQKSDRVNTQYISASIPKEQVDALIHFLIQYRNESQGKRYIDAKAEGVSPEAKDQVEIAWRALSQIANAPKLTKVDEAFGKIALDAMNEMKAVNK